MKKRYLIMAAIASLALVSCSNEEFVGNPELGPGQGKTAEIVFGSIGKGMTRADLIGADAAGKLNNEFVFAGTKSKNNSYVFDQYKAKWATNTANTTESNSNNWEYVSYTPATTTSLTSGTTQTIKYWDYGTTQYDFAAYSLGLGAGTTPTYATPSAITFDDIYDADGADDPTISYTLTGSADELKACYISDLVTAYNQNNVSDYGNVVTFKFRSLASKIRLAFFETVPGYSVKNVQFYSVAENGSASATPTLFASTAVLPSGSGTMTVSFPTTGFNARPGGSAANTDYNKAHVSFAQAENVAAASTLTFDALADFAAAERNETATESPAVGWIGRASNTATYAGGIDATTKSGKYYTILPYEDGANLTLRIKYTLVSTDGSGEVINVDNATAVIPAQLASWKPNYAYTYIFKISDMTNGSTGTDGSGAVVNGLTPITLNAVVVDSEDGLQETITTVSTPSITTYAKGEVVTLNNEYTTGLNIYAVVNDGTNNVTVTKPTATTTATKDVRLYTVTATSSINNITEAAVENALRYGVKGGTAGTDGTGTTYTVTDAATGTFTLTDATSSITIATKIPAADSPTGDDVTVPCATFTAGASGTIYVLEYTTTPRVDGVFTAVAPTKLAASGTTYYTFNGSSYVTFDASSGNVIVDEENKYFTKSGDVYTAVAPAKLTASNTYYTANTRGGAGAFKATGNEIVNAENKYYTASTAPSAGEHMYKIIKVQ